MTLSLTHEDCAIVPGYPENQYCLDSWSPPTAGGEWKILASKIVPKNICYPDLGPADKIDRIITFGDSLSDTGRMWDKSYGMIPSKSVYH